MAEFNKNMVEAMKRNGAKAVFINDKGEWLFHATKGFVEFKRSEVLDEPSEKVEKKGGKKKANQVVEDVENAADEVLDEPAENEA